MKNIIITIIIPLLISPFFSCPGIDKSIKEGDIIFHETQSGSQSKELKLATGSRYTHMGIIFIKGKENYVYEAVQPVKITPLEKWIARGKNNHYVIKRLKNHEKYLTPANIKKMKIYGKRFLGKNYDIYFDWSDKRMYCSELVWKIYKRTLGIEISELEKLKDFDLSHPEVKELMKKRYGNKIPLNEIVVSPVKIFNSDKLITIITDSQK